MREWWALRESLVAEHEREDSVRALIDDGLLVVALAVLVVFCVLTSLVIAYDNQWLLSVLGVPYPVP